MSTDELRRELDRISGSAPDVHVAHDTWARARRAAVRDRLAVGGVAVTVVAAVAGGVTWLPDRLEPPVANTRSSALPDHLYAVPEWMSDREDDGSWSRSEVSDDLNIGVGAAAWVTPWGLPVVVGAVDGDYHLMDLPGFGGNNAMLGLRGYTPTIALSPDGNLLAYSWATFGPDLDAEPISSGVRIADLTTGEVREFAVEGEEGTAVMAIAWSDASRWIAWEGAQPGSWTRESMMLCGECAVAGRIDLVSGDSGIFNPQDIDVTDASVAVDDAGEVSVIANGFVTRWDGTTLRKLDDFDVSLAVEAVSVPSDESGRVVLAGPLGDTFVVLDGDKAEEVDLGAPDDESWQFSPLGWFGDRVLALTDAIDRERGGELQPGLELRLIPLDGGPGTKVGVADPGTQGSLTVAYRIMDAEHLTATRPKPDWPWSEKRWSITIGVGVAAAWAVLILLRRSLRRYRAARYASWARTDHSAAPQSDSSTSW